MSINGLPSVCWLGLICIHNSVWVNVSLRKTLRYGLFLYLGLPPSRFWMFNSGYAIPHVPPFPGNSLSSCNFDWIFLCICDFPDFLHIFLRRSIICMKPRTWNSRTGDFFYYCARVCRSANESINALQHKSGNSVTSIQSRDSWKQLDSFSCFMVTVVVFYGINNFFN